MAPIWRQRAMDLGTPSQLSWFRLTKLRLDAAREGRRGHGQTGRKRQSGVWSVRSRKRSRREGDA